MQKLRTESGVGVVVGGRPVDDVGHAVDPLHVMGALGVAVSGAELGAGLVLGELAEAAVGVHLDEVEGAVEAAVQGGAVSGEGELLVEQVEHAVLGAAEQVDPGADVGGELALGLEGQRELVAAGDADAVGVGPVAGANAIDGAVLGAGLGVGAEALVPLVAGVAVDVVIDLEEERLRV